MHISHRKDCHIVSIFLYLLIIITPILILIRVETIDGSANEGEDYVAINETLTFEPYQKEKEVRTSQNDAGYQEDDGNADDDVDGDDDDVVVNDDYVDADDAVNVDDGNVDVNDVYADDDVDVNDDDVDGR